MSFRPPEMGGDKRLLLLGKTRSGKSFMARWLLKLARKRKWRIVIVDPKKDWMGRGRERRPFAEGKSLGTVDSPVLVSEFRPELAVQIFQPAEWNQQCANFCTAIMAVGYTIIYWDEITQLVTASFVPIEFSILWTQGAALSVGAWCGSQIPRRIPTIVKDQAEIWFMFRLLSKKDRQIVEGYIPTEQTPELIESPLPVRWFWFWEDTMPAPVLVKPLHIEQGVAA